MVLLHTATDAANPGVFLGFGSIELLTGDLPYDNINSMQEATGKRRTGDWLKKLRGQFERIASRRVGPDDVEDVVQDAMRVVAEKGLKGAAGPAAELPHLAWCFQVLRHTIGNHYRRVRTRRQWVVSDTEQVGDENALSHHAIESQGSIEVLLIIEAALAEMANDHPQCGRYLSRLVEGARPREVADEEQLASAVFSRRLYRCRQKLRNLLAMKGVEI